MEFFHRQLNMNYVESMHLVRRGVPFGNALLVKGDVESHTLLDLTVYQRYPRSAIDCVVRMEDRLVRIINAHLGLSRKERRQQIDTLARTVSSPAGSLLVILGDFNIFGAEKTRLQKLGAPADLPSIKTFPSRYPVPSLDRIWTIPHQHIKRVYRHVTPLSKLASDHLPLVANSAM